MYFLFHDDKADYDKSLVMYIPVDPLPCDKPSCIFTTLKNEAFETIERKGANTGISILFFFTVFFTGFFSLSKIILPL